MSRLTFKAWVVLMILGLGNSFLWAGTLSNVSITSTSSEPSATNVTYTFSYTTQSLVPAADYILNITFPDGFSGSYTPGTSGNNYAVPCGDVINSITINGNAVDCDFIISMNTRVWISLDQDVIEESEVVVSVKGINNAESAGVFEFSTLAPTTGGGHTIDDWPGTPSITLAEDGSCGTSHGQTFVSSPSTNLCSAGTAGGVTANANSYDWSCNGTNGGTDNNSCSAIRNYSPEVTLPTTPTIVEDSSDNNIIGVSIADVETHDQALTITATNGTISLSQTTGLSFTTGDGTNDTSMVFSGTLANVNAAIDNLTFTPTADVDSTATIRFQTDDGNNGTDDDTLNITVTAVNDAPTVGTNTGTTVATSFTKTITNTMLNESDVDDSGTGLTYTVTTAPTLGALKLSGTDLAENDTFTQDDIDNSRITYVAESTTGSDSFAFSLADGGEDSAAAATGTFSITLATPTVSYTNTLAESISNDGSVTGSLVITIIGETFVSDVVSSNYVSASNIPDGLTVSFVRDSDTQITMTLTGQATSNTSSNNISNIEVTFTDDAFTDHTAASIIGSTKSDLAMSYFDGVFSNLIADRWNMVSVASGFVIDTTAIGSSYITSGKDIKVYRNTTWSTNPTDANAKEGLWIHPTGTDVPYVGTSNTAYDLADKATQLAYYKTLDSGKWHFVGVQHAMNYTDLTKANITPDSCSTGYTLVNYYDPTNDSWNTTSNIPSGAGIWLRHFCQ